MTGTFNSISAIDRDVKYGELRSLLLRKYPESSRYKKVIVTQGEIDDSVAYFLGHNDISLENLNELDFLKLSFASKKPFTFLKPKHLRRLRKVKTTAQIGVTFVFLSEKYFSMWSNYPKSTTFNFEDRIDRRKTDFFHWLADSKQKRSQIFFSLLGNIESNPDIPIELLIELE